MDGGWFRGRVVSEIAWNFGLEQAIRHAGSLLSVREGVGNDGFRPTGFSRDLPDPGIELVPLLAIHAIGKQRWSKWVLTSSVGLFGVVRGREQIIDCQKVFHKRRRVGGHRGEVGDEHQPVGVSGRAGVAGDRRWQSCVADAARCEGNGADPSADVLPSSAQRALQPHDLDPGLRGFDRCGG